MKLEDWAPIIIALIMSGPGLLAFFGQRKKDNRDDQSSSVDNANKVTSQALTLIEPYKAQIKEFEDKLAVLENKVEKLEQEKEEQDKIIDDQAIRLTENERQIRRFKIGIKKLIDQLTRLGEIPEWNPDEGDI